MILKLECYMLDSPTLEEFSDIGWIGDRIN